MLLMLSAIFYGIGVLAALAGLVFFIMVLVQMFKRDQAVLGIVCIVLIFCGGPLIAFIYGWIKSTEWELKKIMTYWTIAFVVQFICFGLAFGTALGGAAATDPALFNQMDPNNMNLDIDMGDNNFDMPEAFPEPSAND